MAEQPNEEEPQALVDSDDEAQKLAYKPPKQVTMNELLEKDKDDASLNVYKEKLLGGGDQIIIFPENPKRVIVNKLGLLVEGRPDMELDLTGDVSLFKNKTFVLKEKCKYKVRIYFYVQREIVSGLKYNQTGYRKGIKVDKDSFMVGSYAPRTEIYSFTTPSEDAPSGLLLRGVYNIKSLFTDDDKNEHLKWEWNLEIKKDWE